MDAAHDDLALEAQVFALAQCLKTQGRSLAVAESCTGGWLAKVCTDLAGSSVWFERGWVTYSNEAKNELLGVAMAAIETHGAVSEVVAAQMAAGALDRSPADWAVSITGIAGPGGGTQDKPVGTVCFGWAVRAGSVETERYHFEGGRGQIRRASVHRALAGLIERINGPLRF